MTVGSGVLPGQLILGRGRRVIDEPAADGGEDVAVLRPPKRERAFAAEVEGILESNSPFVLVKVTLWWKSHK